MSRSWCVARGNRARANRLLYVKHEVTGHVCHVSLLVRGTRPQGTSEQIVVCKARGHGARVNTLLCVSCVASGAQRERGHRARANKLLCVKHEAMGHE